MSEIMTNLMFCLFMYSVEFLGMLLMLSGVMGIKFKFDRVVCVAFIIENVMYFLRDTIKFTYGNYIGYVTFFVLLAYAYIRKRDFKRSVYVVAADYLVFFFIQLVVVTIMAGILRISMGVVESFPMGMSFFGVYVTLSISYILYKKNKLLNFFNYIYDENIAFIKIIFVLAIIAFFGMFLYHRGMTYTEMALLFSFLVVIMLVFVQYKKTVDLSREKDKRIMIQRMCQDSYEQLILEVRKRQHEFGNHLAALQGMCYTCNDINELTQLQNNYCERILSENKYNRLLYECKNPIIGGFLYSKFESALKREIDIDYKVNINLKDSDADEFELIEMLGIMYDNAVEAVENLEDKKINVNIYQDNNEINIVIQNTSPFVSAQDISSYFKSGFSTKGGGRGIGLPKLKSMVKNCKGKIMAKNYEIDKRNFFEISIILPYKA